MRTPNFVYIFQPVGDNAERTIDQVALFVESDNDAEREEALQEATGTIGECELTAVFELELTHGDGTGMHATCYTS